MNKKEAQNLVENTFEHIFDPNQFRVFIEDLLKRYTEDNSVFDSEKTFSLHDPYIRHAFKDSVSKYERIGQFIDVDGEKIDILIVYLSKNTTLERGRKTMRGFAENYLKSERGRDKSAVLIAYVSPNDEDWRFSFVKLDIKRQRDESGKVKDVIDSRVPAKRFSFLVGKNEFSHTAQKQFSELLQSESSPTLEQIEEAFNIEKVTKDFYLEYEKLFERVRDEIKSLRKSNSALDKHLEERCIKNDEFAKKLLGQILFLYFLQKKGWFGVRRNQDWGAGDKNYIGSLYDRRQEIYQGIDISEIKSPTFFNDVLEPLFYEALAVDRRDNNDYYSRFHSRIPFLNGGLFEKTYDWVNYRIQLPDELFSNDIRTKDDEKGTGILNIFNRFNFTVHESEPLETEVAIDPEMLGNVFENLLLKEERGRSGTFYTPRLIVTYMCRQSLLNYLTTKLLPEGEQQETDSLQLTVKGLEDLIASAEQFAAYEITKEENGKEKNYKSYKGKQFTEEIKYYAPQIDKHLANIKICDPAIGSGAFPVGILQEIVRIRKALTTIKGIKDKSTYELKLHTIQNSIYGVDVEQSAVDIARLRLWLSLVVDEKDRKEIEVLPNLDYKIMQGNSLIDEFEGEKLLPEDFIKTITPKNLATFENKATLRSQLQNEYFEEVRNNGKDSIKAKRIFQDITDITAQINKEKKKDKANNTSKQSNLLTKRIEKSQSRIKELHEKHREIFKTKQSIKKDELRRDVDLIILRFIKERLAEREENLKAQVVNAKIELEAEIKNAKQKLKNYVETAKIKRFQRTLKSLNDELDHLENVRFDLRNLWQKNPNDTTSDLTAIEKENFTPFKSKPFFLWETQFPEIFFNENGEPLENGGFDVVIANPPYGAEFSNNEKKLLSNRYDHIVERIRNSFLYFMGLAYKLSKLDGVVTYIVPNEFLFQIYMTKARNFFLEHTKYLYAINVGEDVFDAIVPACIISFQKQQKLNYTIPVEDLRDYKLEDLEEKLTTTNSFKMSSSKIITETLNNIFTFDIKRTKFVNKIRNSSTPFENYCLDIANGISTSYDDVYIVSKDEVKQFDFENEYTKQCLRGGQIRRYYCPDKTDDFVLYVTKDFEPEKGKNILKYLESHKENLIKKSVEKRKGNRDWHILFRSRYEELFEIPKIIFRQTGDSIIATLDEDIGYYCINSVHIAKLREEFEPKARFLLGVINSKLVNFYYREISQEAGRVLAEVKPQRLRALPIPEASENQTQTIKEFVNYIFFLIKNDGDELIKNYFESIIDGLVYELFLEDELHAADKKFFEPLEKEILPDLTKHEGNEGIVIKKLFEKLSDIEHPIRNNLYFLSNLASIRLIEGK